MADGIETSRSDRERGLMLLGRIGTIRDIVQVMDGWGDADPAANWRSLHDWLVQANEEVQAEISLLKPE